MPGVGRGGGQTSRCLHAALRAPTWQVPGSGLYCQYSQVSVMIFLALGRAQVNDMIYFKKPDGFFSFEDLREMIMGPRSKDGATAK